MRKGDSRFEELPDDSSSSSSPSSSSSSSLPKTSPKLPHSVTPQVLSNSNSEPTEIKNTNKSTLEKSEQGAQQGVNDDGDDDDDGGVQNQVRYDSSELKDILERATSSKIQGNGYFGKGNYKDALTSYKEGLSELPPRQRKNLVREGKQKESEDQSEDTNHEPVRKPTESEREEVADENDHDDDNDDAPTESIVNIEEPEESSEMIELRSMLHANVAACFLKLERWKEAVTACDEALIDNPKYVKALSRRATANEAISTWSSLSSAQADYDALDGLPGVTPQLATQIKQAKIRLPGKIELQQQKEKDEVLGKLKDLGNTVLGKFGLSTDNFKFVQQAGGGYSMNFER